MGSWGERESGLGNFVPGRRGGNGGLPKGCCPGGCCGLRCCLPGAVGPGQPGRCPLVSRRARLDAAFKARLVPPRFLRIYLLKDFLLTIVVGTMDFILFYCIALDNLTTSNICHYQE
jgi:hypothetical protein